MVMSPVTALSVIPVTAVSLMVRVLLRQLEFLSSANLSTLSMG